MSYEFSKCVKADDGTIYCWDCIIEKFVKIDPKVVSTSEIPEAVLEEFMSMAFKDKENK